MRKIIKTFLTLSFIYALFLLAVIALSVIFNLNFLLIIIGLEIIGLIFCVFIITSRKKEESKVAWITVIVFFPLFGLVTYWLFGRNWWENKIFAQRYEKWKLQLINVVNKNHQKTIKMIADDTRSWKISLRDFPELSQGQAKILTSGPAFFSHLLNDLAKAEHFIFLNFYIIADGEILNAINDILQEKAKANVKIYIIADHAGALLYRLSKQTMALWKKWNIQFVINVPVNWASLMYGRLPYRTHRKDVVIDGKIAYTGGVGVGDNWIGTSGPLGFYNDLQVRFAGPAVIAVICLFIKDWLYASQNIFKSEALFKEILDFLKTKKILSPATTQLHPCVVSGQDPGQNNPDQINIYVSWIMQAKKRIWISTPYFIPPLEIMSALTIACQAGIEVRILIPGLTDKAFILDLSRSYCRQLFEAGVEIYELNNTFNHAKIMTIDDDIIIMGSTNLDYRSFYIDKQTMVIIKSHDQAQKIAKWWAWNWAHATRWVEPVLNYKNPFYLFLLRIIRLTAPIL